MRRIFATLILASLLTSACDGDSTARVQQFVQHQALPGPLSSSHASRAADCESCHTPLLGVEAQSCIACHALNGVLVERQTTAFHAFVTDCTGCHIEHAGDAALLGPMDHEHFASIAEGPNSVTAEKPPRSLECMSCHERQDPHGEFLGRECAACHSTNSWTIAAYRHPSARSRDCAQCHAAPPSHYMEHFSMMSTRVAHQEGAVVSDCYRCHLTTRWNDIRGVGYYDHH